MEMTYKGSGVDKSAGYREVELIKKAVKKTHSPQVLANIGGFAGLFKPNLHGYENPVFVSGTDGVGTKLLVAAAADMYATVGEDLVAMCVNDVLCQGAEPLFFLDYIACGSLDPEKAALIVSSIADGCVQAGCALIGGETAEMPGMYSAGHYDLAGFCVGIVDEKNIIDRSRVTTGDIVFALPSSGLHSNGYSLVRKIVFEHKGFSVDTYVDELGCRLADELLKPTRIYAAPLRELIKKFTVHGISHITGGGLYENVPRMLPSNVDCRLDISAVPVPPIFSLLQDWGNVSRKEMYGTFNMGVGMVFAVSETDAEAVSEFLTQKNEAHYRIGEIISGTGTVIV